MLLDLEPDPLPGDGLDRQLWLEPLGALHGARELPCDCDLSVDGEFHVGGNDDTLFLLGCQFLGGDTPFDDPSTGIDETTRCGLREVVGEDADAICSNASEAEALSNGCLFHSNQQACMTLDQLLANVPALQLAAEPGLHSTDETRRR
ncbi:MAG: hypothetical protein AAGF11_47455 [Myxococcota bacterium]